MRERNNARRHQIQNRSHRRIKRTEPVALLRGTGSVSFFGLFVSAGSPDEKLKQKRKDAGNQENQNHRGERYSLPHGGGIVDRRDGQEQANRINKAHGERLPPRFLAWQCAVKIDDHGTFYKSQDDQQ